MNYYRCAVYNHNYTFGDDEPRLGLAFAALARVAVVSVRAGNLRAAAARAYVRTAGRLRARVLRRINAPSFLIELETDAGLLEQGLTPAAFWLGDCFVWDNAVEAWYITVEQCDAYRRRLAVPRYRLARRGRRRARQALRASSRN